NSCPCLTAIRRFENTAGRPGIPAPRRGNEDDIRVVRINQDRGYTAGIGQPDIHPRYTGVSRFVETIAARLFAGSYEYDVRPGRSHRQGANCSYVNLIEYRLPGAACVCRFPNTPARRTKVVDRGLTGYSGNTRYAAGAERTYQPPP